MALVMVLGCSASAFGRERDESGRWWLCSDPTPLAEQLRPVVKEILARVERSPAQVVVGAAPLGEGSAEYLIASAAEVLDQLRASLVARKVPQRRVAFQWLSAAVALPGAPADLSCAGSVVFLELSFRTG